MSRMIDLTLTLTQRMRGVEFEPATAMPKDGWNTSILHLYSHSGTHMDAPVHFGVSSETIDGISLERCIGPAWVIDAEDVQPHGLITIEHIGSVAERFAPGESLLIKTGWSSRSSQPEYRDALPRISMELAEWCAQHKVKMLGVEQPAVADVNNLDEITAVHRVLLEAGIVIVEGLTNLHAIEKERVLFMAFPLKISGGDGSPVRALVIEEGGCWEGFS